MIDQEKESHLSEESDEEVETDVECESCAPPPITYREALSCAEKLYQYGLDNQQQDLLKSADTAQAALLKACPAAHFKQQYITSYFPLV